MSLRTAPTANLFPLVLAGLLAAAAFWLEQASRPQLGDTAKLRHDPDYWVENFRLRRFNIEGSLQHTLLGTRMRHYPDDDSTLVEQPHLTYHREFMTVVVAREGHLDGKGEHIRLIDDVRISRAGRPGKPDSVLTTEILDAYPDDEIAMTEVPVTITQGLSNVRGNRLHADNKTATYVLDSEVNGIFFRNGGISRQSVPITTQGLPAPSEVAPARPAARAPAEPKPQSRQKAKPPTKPAPKPKPKPAPKPSR